MLISFVFSRDVLLCQKTERTLENAVPAIEECLRQGKAVFSVIPPKAKFSSVKNAIDQNISYIVSLRVSLAFAGEKTIYLSGCLSMK